MIRAVVVLIFALPTVAAVIYTLLGYKDFGQTAAAIGIFSLLAASLTVMAAELARSLKKTLYAYKNIMLIGGILFVFVLTAVVIFCTASGFFTDGIDAGDIYSQILRFPRDFSYYAVFVIFVMCVALGISNIALIRHEGFRPKNALSVIVAALYIGGTAAVYALSDLLTAKAEEYYLATESKVFLLINTAVPMFLLLMICYFECVLVGTVVMGWLAARQVPVYDKDYIIILGCSIDKKGGLLPLLKGRVNRAVRFAWEQEIATGKPLKYVPSGGQGANEVMSEGSAMELYLLTKGAENYEVFPEKKSRTTLENMLFSKAIIDKMKPDAKIAFATTNYHMLRSGIIARKAGIDAEGIAGDTKWYFWPNGFIREFFGILKMNIRAHISVAVVIAAVCAAVGIMQIFM